MDFQVGSERVTVNTPDMPHLLAAVSRALSAHTGFALATLNLDHLVKLRGDAGFCAAYRAQDIVTADGNPVVWMARIGGQPVDLLPGADLIVPLCELAAAHGAPIGLVGSTKASLDRATAALVGAVPGVTVAITLSPPMGVDPASAAADAILADLEKAGVALCFLALGAPKQEILAARGRTQTPHIGFVSIGAGLDFLSGAQTRAPDWVRALAMEWLWRMLSQPRRLVVRYTLCALILPGHVWRSWRMRLTDR